MATSDLAELTKGYGPTEEQRMRILDSIYGSVIGMATAALLSFGAYVLVVVLFLRFLKEEVETYVQEDPWLFWPLLITPVVLIVIFFVIPGGIRAYRERQIHKLTPAVKPVAAGYFRIQPFEATDAERYQRPDDAQDRALAWLRRVTDPVLYLSGASGVGKSSLVAAGLVPALTAAGWTVLAVRGMGEPHASLTKALKADQRLVEKPPAGEDPYDLLQRASRRLKVTAETRLLVVLDQFEEYLILEAGETRETYARFLERLVTEPIPFVHLLHVFREDYRALLFAHGLPPFVPGQTGFELAPFSRVQADAFLTGAPRVLDERGYQALFAGLDRIEETPGLYRPITLNMVGYVPDRQGAHLATNPARLIESYIRGCVGSGPTRDFNKRVLQAMITGEGTKRQVSVPELVAATRLTDIQVRGALYKFGSDGLVRDLGGDRWEISHDFLARQLDRVLGRIRAPLLQRAALPVLGAALLGWIAAVALGLPYWSEVQTRKARNDVFAAGFSLLPCDGGGTCLSAQRVDNLDAALSTLAATNKLLNITELDLSVTGVRSLEPLAGLTGLTKLDLTGAKITSLEPLAGLTRLAELDLRSTGVTSLEPLAGLTGLTGLGLIGTGVTSLEPLAGLTGLTDLDLSETGVTSLEPLAGLTGLTWLNLTGTGVTSLEPLASLTGLTVLDLSETGVTSLEPLAGLTELTWLGLTGTGVRSLEPLVGLTELTELDLRSTGVTSLEPLAGLTELTLLDLSGTEVASLEPLAGLTELTWLGLTGTGVRSLEPLVGLTELTELDLRSTGVTSLEPLAGLTELTLLDLSGTEVASLEPLAGLTGLSELDLRSTGVTSLEPLAGLTELTWLNLTGTGVASLEPLAGLTGLTVLGR